MAKIHIWGGRYDGPPSHPIRDEADWIIEQLHAAGHTAQYWSTHEFFDAANLAEADLIIFMGLEFTTMAMWQQEFEPLSDAHFAALEEYLRAGKALLSHHSGIGSFDDRPELTRIFDGRWLWEEQGDYPPSTHGPVSEFEVSIAAPSHPICAGLENFRLTDELYYQLIPPQFCEVLLQADYNGQSWPLAWAGHNPHYNNAKVAYCGLGHDMNSYASPSLQRFLINSIQWLLD